MNEPKPCPFCGGKGYFLHITDYDGAEWWTVGCDNIGCPFAPYEAEFDTDTAAFLAWNTRPNEGSLEYGGRIKPKIVESDFE